ncbi:uncharacterized protein LOC121055320 [Oryza brachyantha]|uniref:uncharacterized protein LOC121055320 n=1 Tax=Oryza brachyantha TaxID=4533 RepID=UPI001ADB60C7|nr:uncharacterized protein LOC121055320 [Oryza brachyantha]
MAFQTITKVNVSNDSSVLTSLDAQGHVSYMGQKPMGRGEWVANGLKIVQQKVSAACRWLHVGLRQPPGHAAVEHRPLCSVVSLLFPSLASAREGSDSESESEGVLVVEACRLCCSLTAEGRGAEEGEGRRAGRCRGRETTELVQWSSLPPLSTSSRDGFVWMDWVEQGRVVLVPSSLCSPLSCIVITSPSQLGTWDGL